MEKFIGKVVTTDGIADFTRDFLTWAGGNTAQAELQLDGTELVLELVVEHNAEDPLVRASGLAGAGAAVAAWADAEGFSVVDDEDDEVSIESPAGKMPDVAADYAGFLGPTARWRITTVEIRRRP